MANEAEETGADIFLKININEVIKNENNDIVGVKGTGPNGEIIFHSKIVIDATGFTSVISKAMGFVTQWKRFGAGAEYEAIVENSDPDTWWLMVGQEYTPAGYAWIFPLGNNIVRIGVGVGKPESDIDPTQRLKEIIEKHQSDDIFFVWGNANEDEVLQLAGYRIKRCYRFDFSRRFCIQCNCWS